MGGRWVQVRSCIGARAIKTHSSFAPASHALLATPCPCLVPSAVYYGPVASAQPYFEGLGYEFPLQQNPADALMDIVSGALLRPGQVRCA